ncbi:ketoacyl-ACP synthase III [Vibrio harveyi]
MGFNILSSGSYLPVNQWSDREMDRFLKLPSGTCRNKFDVEYRHVASTKETAVYMAMQAIMQCLGNTHSLSSVDLLIYASGTHHQALPYDASAVLAALDAPTSLESFDLNSTCLSFLSALNLAQNLFIAKRYQRIIIVTSELATGITLNRSFTLKPEVATLFADGAAAFLLEQTENEGLITNHFETHHAGYSFCQIKGGGSHINPHTSEHQAYLKNCQFEMEGKALFRHVRKTLPAFLEKGFSSSPVTLRDIDYFLPHQASAHGLKKLPSLVGLPKEKTVNHFSTLGNQVAASLPINLHWLRNQPGTQGKHVLLAGTAAGLSLGMGVLKL